MENEIELLEEAFDVAEVGARLETGSAGWIDHADTPLHGVLHTPQSVAVRSTAVVIVPPFGWQELASHRARRYWATRLARSGLLTLRYDLPATGDSFGSPRDAGTFDNWVGSVGTAVSALRTHPSVHRVAVVGIGLGGLIAATALARGAGFEDLLLWGVPGRGRTLLREMTVYAAMATSEYASESPDYDLEGGLDLAGFYVSEETAAAVSAIDLTTLDLPARRGGRVLLMGRDTDRRDGALAAPFEQAGMSVTTALSKDFPDLMTRPQDPLLRRPEATIERSIAWLAEADAAAEVSGLVRPETIAPTAQVESVPGHRLEAAVSCGSVVESIIPIRVEGVSTDAILSRPASGGPSPLTAVLLGPGAIRKVGMHRMSVEIARRWAARGIPTVRFDITAVGDAAGPEDDGEDERPVVAVGAMLAPSKSADVASIVGQLRDRLGLDRFVAVGHCSGGYLAFHAAMGLEGAAGAITINQPVMSHSDDLHQARMFALLQEALRGGFVRRWRQKRLTLRELRWAREAVMHRMRVRGQEPPERRHREDAILMLDTLAVRNVSVTMIVSRDYGVATVFADPEFPDPARWTNLHRVEIPSRDGSYHALGLQKIVHEQVDAALDRILAEPVVE